MVGLQASFGQTPQPIMCGTQVNIGGSSPRDIMGPENVEKISELADKLKVQCIRETVVIPQQSLQRLARDDINVSCSYMIPKKGKGVV